MFKFLFIYSTIFTAFDCESGTKLGTRDTAVSRAVLPLAGAEMVEKQLEGAAQLHLLFLGWKLNTCVLVPKVFIELSI